MSEDYTNCPVCNRRVRAQARIHPHRVEPWIQAPACPAEGRTFPEAIELRARLAKANL